MTKKKYITWIIWITGTTLLAFYLGYKMFGNDSDKGIFLIGETTHGHYQIEMACSACHKDSFGGKDSLQDACLDCHAEELKLADDSHPRSKFTDPRNADRVEILDARYCITCHQEHNKDITNKMGLTLQDDYCFRCHSDIAEERPTHAGLDFNSCASAGCHNYHDNRALYEDFLEKHLDEEDHHIDGKVMQRDLAAFVRETMPGPVQALGAQDADAPDSTMESGATILDQWHRTSHAASGVNCSDCHYVSKTDRSWTDKPGTGVCNDCHKKEIEGFLSGKHGMRLKQDLSAMFPGMARLPMKTDSHMKELGCNSCHSPHEYDTTRAAYEQCLSCHNDEHSLAYEGSPHHALWLQEISGSIDPGKGVSCATCHMPRESVTDQGVERTLVQHNQNANLRPNEKMIRDVCMNCHGIDFTINSLADIDLIRKNFSGPSSIKVQSTEWVKKRVLERSNK
jgi:hypothetical protein